MPQQQIDFTGCRRIMGKAFNGANGKKIAVEYDGRQYMIKFPPSAGKKQTELSYTNSCISEHIASSVFNMLGIKAHETLLGTFTVNKKTKLVCACGDFTADGKILNDFCSIKNSVIDSETHGSGTELSELLETIDMQQFVEPKSLRDHFWNMFVADALLGNFDRHNGNWGFLYDSQTQTSTIAPVYDCGSCLLPQADETVMKDVLENEDKMNARIFQFPTSAIRLNGKKLNYYDFLKAGGNADCNKALLRIYPKINLQEIGAFINDVPYVSDLQKEFYIRYIGARYELMIQPAFELAAAEEPSENFAEPMPSM